MPGPIAIQFRNAESPADGSLRCRCEIVRFGKSYMVAGGLEGTLCTLPLGWIFLDTALPGLHRRESSGLRRILRKQRLPARRRERRSAYVRITAKAESVQGGNSTDSVSSPMCLKGKAPLPNNVVRRILRSSVYQG